MDAMSEWVMSIGVRSVVIHHLWKGIEDVVCSEFVQTHIFNEEVRLHRMQRKDQMAMMYYGMRGVLMMCHALTVVWSVCQEGWGVNLGEIGIAAMWSMVSTDVCMLYRQTGSVFKMMRHMEVWCLCVGSGVASYWAREWMSYYMVAFIMSSPLYLVVVRHSMCRSTESIKWKPWFYVSMVASVLGWVWICVVFAYRVWARTAGSADWVVNSLTPILINYDVVERERIKRWFRVREQTLY